MPNIILQKPFLKWAGGKTQIIQDVMKHFPSEMNNYHELFVGGGSVLLAMLSMQQADKIKITGKIYAYDINPIVINVYKHVQSDKEELFKFVSLYITEYDNIDGDVINRKPLTIKDAKTSQESYYYWIRNKFNNMDKSSVESSAIFMFLNKTCFRGLYREGPNGFNVPFGHYKTTPTIITKDELDTISSLIQHVEFQQSDFIDSIKLPSEHDFVYMDPPYAPETTKSFVKYTQAGFTLEMHESLFKAIKLLNTKKIKFAMSNSSVSLVTTSLSDYNIDYIVARRSINSKKPNAKTTEVIVYN